ncbi:hypothetical protein DAI22_07g255450 [Oryza sativa Japonica Group]|nr:hypothetical protein DAI22_07g255450 [Oryza sativa Japonica Group]
MYTSHGLWPGTYLCLLRTVRANASACGLPPPTNNEGDGRRRRGAARRGEQLVATVPAGRRARGSRCGEGEGTIHAIPQWLLPSPTFFRIPNRILFAWQ